MTSKDNSSLEAQWTWLMQEWVHEKERAKKSNDWTQYIWFLKEMRRNFSKLYAGFTNEKWIALFDQVLETITCELQESVIKSNNGSTHIMSEPKKKQIEAMSDEELLEAYKTGAKWLSDRQQVTNTDTNELGQAFDPIVWDKGLKRIERLEAEMQKRGLAY